MNESSPESVRRGPSRQGFARWRRLWRRTERWARRKDIFPRLELIAACTTIVMGWSSYALLTGTGAPANGASPSLVTALLVANLIPVMLLVVLIARRIAILLANRRRGLAGAQLHIRLVALFAGIAAVPTLLVVIFASLLFQFGVQFWFSDRVKTVLDSSNQVAQAYYEENRQRVASDIIAMDTDINAYARDFGLGTEQFGRGFRYQMDARGFEEAAWFARAADGTLEAAAISGLTVAELARRIRPEDFAQARIGNATLVAKGRDRVEALLVDDAVRGRFLYVSRKVDPAILARADKAAGALGEYQALRERSRVMQLRFNLILMGVSLLTLAVAIWFALWLANRLVAPIARLALAAERVGAGDLDARVRVVGSPDELGTLARAFNRMTSQLKTQQNELLAANHQLDVRRQFTEAVLSGVSAGVLSISAAGIIRVANSSAAALLQMPAHALEGQPLSQAVPALGNLLNLARQTGDASGQVRIERGTETQTLAVRIGGEAGPEKDEERGYVLTFDDISAQLANQRRAAWADVARRIAHEIKNPLTPIQLAAERLQRKFGRQITEDADTFGTLTSTIVRQVGDLRRMVDEFSEFARLPKPLLAPDSIERTVAQALVLQEVAFPAIHFTAHGEAAPLVCDRNQIGQALTNLVKNAAEAVTARLEREQGAESGRIAVEIADGAEFVTITVTDNGIGLPHEARDRLTEPYVTTRARGTGLGLAIVKKIIADHGGTLDLGDADPGPGACVRVRLSRNLAAGDQPFPPPPFDKVTA
ncbi:PAS domain-containing sensor histidine kinase [Sandarakinorhabdus sp.]|uniref:sensor histidine kinase n=1 Tax=Sandarakinorhabdus sp. TaxID=1916663 RepID=UPI00286E05DA|nr:PAS domain-containing sensor histidine kinase [Sandarakinorhabdus sp.]